MQKSFRNLLTGLLVLTLLLSTASAFGLPWPWLKEPTTIRLASSHHLEVPADRALLSIHIHSKGASQSTVSEEIRSSQTELLNLMKPFQHDGRIKNPPNTSDTDQTIISSTADGNLEDDAWLISSPNLHIRVKSLDTSNFRTRSTILGERPLYEASMEYEVEVEKLSILSDVVFEVSRLPRTRIERLKWKLSDRATEVATGECMNGAARLLRLKADKAMHALGLKSSRPVYVREEWNEWRPRSWESNYLYDGVDEVRLASYHDELDGAYIAPRRSLEPKALEFEVKLDGEFVAN